MTSILPLIETPRLVLRGAQHADLRTLQEHWNAPLVRRFLFDDQPVDEALAASVLGACLDAASRGHGLWLLIERTSKEVLGCVALMRTSVAAEYETRLTGLLEPMVSLVPRRWGHGFATECLSAALDYAFNTLQVHSVAAVNDVPNAASEKMLLRAGFSVLSEVDGPKYRMRTYVLLCRSWLERNDA